MYLKTCGNCQKPLDKEEGRTSIKSKRLICSSCYENEKNPYKGEKTYSENRHEEQQLYRGHCDSCNEVSRSLQIDENGNKTCGECRKNSKQADEQKPCEHCGAPSSFIKSSEVSSVYATKIDNPKRCSNCDKLQGVDPDTAAFEFRYRSFLDTTFEESESIDEDLNNAEAEAQRITEKNEKALKQFSNQNFNFNLEEQVALIKKQSESSSKQEKDETQQQQQQQQQQPEENKVQKEILGSISSIVGMKNTKVTLTEWLQMKDARALLQSKTNIELPKISKNIVITGNPGVGKTMLAEKLAPVLFEAGFITEDKFIDVKIDEIIGQYIGETTKKTKGKIQEAKNGVFFLDEAYRLAGGSFAGSKSNYGLEAIETIMSHMNDPKNNIVFIFAGYEDKMQGFLDENPGLRSLVNEPFRLTDYTLEELTKIGIHYLQSKNYDTSQIEDIFSSYIHQNMKQGILAGNGTTVIQYADEVSNQHLLRIQNNPETKNYDLLLSEDVKNAFEKDQEEQDGLTEIFLEAKKEINELIGLHNVKKEVEKLGNFQFIQTQRKKEGLKVERKSNHMIFLGDAGTGKTTVARLVGKLFRGAGVLTNGHFVEATKDMLTAGSSIPKTVKMIVEKAKGGALFIDEAYTLTNDGKGKEALDALIPLMENHKDEFICIFAGYEKDMQKLFQLNQGLKSRIPNHFHFEDYDAYELTQMMIVKMNKEEYHLAEGANQTLQEAIELSVEQNLVDGNGRWVRNFFEQISASQTDRLYKEALTGRKITKAEYQTFTSNDISEAITTLHSMTTKNS